MAISAAMVKELRERTGSGMMECKKALIEANGDIEAAVEVLRKAGLAKADKKSGRTAAEGRIVIASSADEKRAIMLEVNSETDFVANDDNFVSFVNAVANRILDSKPSDIEALSQMPLKDGEAATVGEARQALVAKIGENITVRRFVAVESPSHIIASYLHGIRIGVMVEMEGGTPELGRDIAMHIAASRPICLSENEVSAELVEKEKEIFRAQAAESGKPADIIEKMVAGRIKKFMREVTLLGQPFVKDPDTDIEKLLKNAGAKVIQFQRFEVGEGIEKKEGNFAEEVMAQARGN